MGNSQKVINYEQAEGAILKREYAKDTKLNDFKPGRK